MKKFWKVLGITAAVAALTPYRIYKDEETGEKKIEALLWRATTGTNEEEKMTLDVSVGIQSPFAPKSEEPLFEEELVAEFEITDEDQSAGEAEDGEAPAEEPAAAQEEPEASEEEPAQEVEDPAE